MASTLPMTGGTNGGNLGPGLKIKRFSIDVNGNSLYCGQTRKISDFELVVSLLENSQVRRGLNLNLGIPSKYLSNSVSHCFCY